MELLTSAFIYLMAAVIAVPIAKRFGLGSVLGYLLAGIIIGPVIGLIGSESEEIKHFAEFGVVMMLFLVGLELRPSMLWRMRSSLLGLGGMQVTVTALIILGITMAFGFSWQMAAAIGMTLALSSTAIVLQTMNEKGIFKTPAGQSSFAVLLFQDIAVIPMLAVMPLLAVAGIQNGSGDAHHGGAMISGYPAWVQTLIVIAVIGGIIGFGKFLTQPLFRFIAQSRLREIFTAAALLLVISAALLMNMVGLSPALGTFLAGVVLSGSEYRHELESDIEPFKGLLLGLFFITVGAGIDFNLLLNDPLMIVGIALGIMAVKFIVLFGLAYRFKLRSVEAWLFALGLSQAGEFAFVLFGFAESSNVLPSEIIQPLMLSVALTMLLTPLLFIFHDKVIATRAIAESAREADSIDEHGTVIIAGVGRFGQVIARLLLTNDHNVVVLDNDPTIIEQMGKSGIKAYYGDPTRPDLLHVAGVESATLFVAAADGWENQITLVQNVVKANPNCHIIARAINRHHVYRLEQAGAHFVIREMFESALAAGRHALEELGDHGFRAAQKARVFRRHDEKTLELLKDHWTEDDGVHASYLEVMRLQTEELYAIMKADLDDSEDAVDLDKDADTIAKYDQQGV